MRIKDWICRTGNKENLHIDTNDYQLWKNIQLVSTAAGKKNLQVSSGPHNTHHQCKINIKLWQRGSWK